MAMAMDPPLFHYYGGSRSEPEGRGGRGDPPDADAGSGSDAEPDNDAELAPPPADADVGNGKAVDVGDDDPLDLEEVNLVATEEEYELVYFSKKGRLISFEPAAGGAADRDDGDALDGRPRIDVYWATGAVGVSLTHPTRGEATRPSLHRGVGPRRLTEIFRNPRAYAEGGRFEAARDDGDADPPQAPPPPGDYQDVALLQETNEMLRRRLDDCQAVQVTGPRGHPVYATGSFRDGRREGGFWGVDLAAPTGGSEAVVGIPLSALEDVEVRLGGVVYASALSHDVKARMDDRDWDGEDRKEVPCRLGGPVTGCWLPLRIEGWPRKDWEGLQRRDLARRRNEHRPDPDVYGALLDLQDGHPRATVSFHRLSFFGGCVEGMAGNLGLAPPRGAGGEGRGEEGLWNIANAIVATLRSAGCDDVGEAFMKRVNDVQMAAYWMLGAGTNKAVDAEILTLVQLQLDSVSTANFLSQVGTRYNISSLAGI